jgi:hypothetical protein
MYRDCCGNPSLHTNQLYNAGGEKNKQKNPLKAIQTDRLNAIIPKNTRAEDMENQKIRRLLVHC